MVREATSCCQPTSGHSRSHRRHRHRHETCHCSDEDRSSVSSNTKDWGAGGIIQDPLPIISTWSEPVLDTHSSGRFQYQARVTPDGYHWTISGSDSGTNPHFLSSVLNPSSAYPLGTLAVTYPTGSYISEQPIQSRGQHYDRSNAGENLANPPTNEESKDYDFEEYYEEETPHDKSKQRQNASSQDHRNKRKDKQRSHHSHSHSHHRPSHHHRQSRSHKDHDLQKHTDQGHNNSASHSKVNEWLHNYKYADG
ncbi:hypothetical protein F4803DRAFT_355537 [Xylaria telfairii]|nr:hypothetical protein F4803DRAFT_355537 [Xylaria telfairii]